HTMKSQVPTSVPGILPRVRHQDHVVIAQMLPGVIASVPAFFGRRGFGRIARQPAKNVVIIELLGPQQTGKGLPLHETLISGELGGMHGIIELIGFHDAPSEDGSEICKWILLRFGTEAHFYREGTTWRDDRFGVPRKFAALMRVDPIM